MKDERNKYMRNERGQVILVLILVMTVALAIGISVIQRSISDISTASKGEQSSRAFSAAEAGIEDKLSGGTGSVNFTGNSSTANVAGGDLIPVVQSGSSPQNPLEYPPLAKEEVAHVWLADPDDNVNLPGCTVIPPSAHVPICYKQSTLDVYWGNSITDKAALELTLVYYDGSKYTSRKWYLDNSTVAPPRSPANNFDTHADCSGFTVASNSYQCKYTIGGTNGGVLDPGGVLPSSPSVLMLLRARLLYNNTSQPFAVQAVGSCVNCSLPPQQKKITSTGTAGTTQRKVQLFQVDKVVPPYFDYAIFSTGAINK